MHFDSFCASTGVVDISGREGHEPLPIDAKNCTAFDAYPIVSFGIPTKAPFANRTDYSLAHIIFWYLVLLFVVAFFHMFSFSFLSL